MKARVLSLLSSAILLGVACASIPAVVPIPATVPAAPAEAPYWPKLPPYEAGLYLSWEAPFGSPGAASNLTTSCADTTHVDSLYLVFDAGQQIEQLTSVEATLYFTAAPGDSIEDFWFFKTGTPNGGSLLIELHHQHDLPCPRPWYRVAGDGRVSYDVVGGRGRLELSYAVQPGGAPLIVPGVPYCLGRITISHRRNHLAGCREPVCIQWADLRIAYGSEGKDVRIDRGENRFASWNSPTGAVCEPQRAARRIAPWKPGGQ